MFYVIIWYEIYFGIYEIIGVKIGFCKGGEFVVKSIYCSFRDFGKEKRWGLVYKYKFIKVRKILGNCVGID